MKSCYQLQELFGENVARLRCKQELTIAALSRMTGISRMTLHKVERGKANLSFSRFELIANALCVEPYVLILPPREER